MLPIELLKEEIVRTIKENQITIIEGATGCGKTTKVPIYLAEAGYNVIVTQPRRLAAMMPAKYVAEQFGNKPVGDLVGFYTGIECNYSNNSQIIYSTEGSELLFQLSPKIMSTNNNVLIIDEIHEWSIEADVLLAYVKKLISDGTNLKLVVMSATLESNLLACYLNNAPVIKIRSNAYNVGYCQKPAVELENVILSLARCKNNILVFLPGKNEIANLKKSLTKLFKSYNVKCALLELHSDISSEEQQRTFYNYPNGKVILSTNIAQTSVTIPDIDMIVDSGLEKRLDIIDDIPSLCLKTISQSDSIQRKGRAGRCTPGFYYLCCDTKFENMHPSPIPDIYCLRMDTLLLSLVRYNVDICSLDFFHKPNEDNLQASWQLLHNLGAIDEQKNITELGIEMNKIPLNVRYSRILVEAKKYGVEYDALICCLLLEYGSICYNRPMHALAFYKSDLFYEVELFKQAIGPNPILLEDQNINKVNFSKISMYFNKLLERLHITKSNIDIDTISLKKCLLTGLADWIFVYENGVGYKNSLFATPRLLPKNSCLFKKYKKILVGMPMNFSNYPDDTDFTLTRLIFPTEYSLDELLEFMPELFTTKHTISNGIISSHILYNDIEIDSFELGTVEELHKTRPEGFHEEIEYLNKFKQNFKCFYFYDLKLSSIVA